MSDNWTNFVGAAEDFNKCFNERNWEAMFECLARGHIIWKFNLPGSPNFGGIWERLVRSCKKTMFAILWNRRLTLPVLTATMCLVEQIRHASIWTPVSDDPQGLEAWTQNQFLLGRPVVAQPLIPDSVKYVDSRKIFKVAQAHVHMISNRWAEEYLTKWNVWPKCPYDDERVPKVGGLVWLIDDSVRDMRTRWREWLKCSLELTISFDQHQSRPPKISSKDQQWSWRQSSLIFLREGNKAGDVGAKNNEKSWNLSILHPSAKP